MDFPDFEPYDLPEFGLDYSDYENLEFGLEIPEDFEFGFDIPPDLFEPMPRPQEGQMLTALTIRKHQEGQKGPE